MNYVFSRITLPALGIIFMLLGGCGTTQPSKFYLLSPADAAGDESPNSAEGIAIGIGPVTFPGYLDRPQMVIRSSPNGLRLAEFERWAEPLKDNFETVLLENISNLLSTNRIVRFLDHIYLSLDYRVLLDVARFEGGPDGMVTLSARWVIVQGKEILAVQATNLQVPWEDEGDYEALVAAKSKALADLSKEIAEAFKKVMASNPPQTETGE